MQFFASILVVFISTSIVIVQAIPAILKIYGETDAYPNESSLIIQTSQNVLDFSIYPGSESPVGLCSNGSWLLYPSTQFRGEAIIFLGLVHVPFCLNSGEKAVQSIQLVGNGFNIDVPSITLFESADYNGNSTAVDGDGGNITFPFVSFILTGYFDDNRNDMLTFYDDFNQQGTSFCIMRRSFVRNITQDFGLTVGNVKSFKYGCPFDKILD